MQVLAHVEDWYLGTVIREIAMRCELPYEGGLSRNRTAYSERVVESDSGRCILGIPQTAFPSRAGSKRFNYLLHEGEARLPRR